MKKILAIIGVLAIALSLSACSEQYNPIPRDETRTIHGADFKIIGEEYDDVAILEDRNTGCQYLIVGKDKYTTGMANYLDEKGKPVGCKGVE